jgi:hypothetical protein
VVSAHLLKNRKKIRVKPSRPYSVDVVLHYHQQPFYSQLHRAVVEELTALAPHYLD